MDIYFILWIIIKYSVICYVAELIPALEAPLGCFLCPLTRPIHLFLSASLLSGTLRCFGFIFSFFLPQP